MSFWTELYKTGKKLASYPPSELDYEFPPLYHATSKADVRIELDENGNRVSVDVLPMKDRIPIIFPVTNESAKRTQDAANCPHPLCDSPSIMGDKYIALLNEWAEDADIPYLNAVLAYVSSDEFREDIEKYEIPAKARICWTVTGTGGTPNCWENEELMESWTDFYTKKISKTAERDVCMVTGKIDIVQDKHPKALVPGHANGKMISSNNDRDFVFLGMFENATEAACISAEASHYAHQALKWLMNHGGRDIGNGNILCIWSPEAPKELQTDAVLAGLDTKDIPFVIDKAKAGSMMYGSHAVELDPSMKVVTMVVGGNTKGRLSLNYYQEDNASAYLDRMNQWCLDCSWEKWDKEENANVFYSPALYTLIDWAFGVETKGFMRASDSERNAWLKRLMACKLEGRPIPRELVTALVHRANRSFIYGDWIFPVTLAALRKKYKEDGMEYTDALLPLEASDASYLYGRLLAVYQKIEEEYLYARKDNRVTQAMRKQATFVTRPLQTAMSLDRTCKQAWYKKVSPARKTKYEKLLEEIWNALSGNKVAALSPNYLFGYYAQRKVLFEKTNNNNNNNVEEN